MRARIEARHILSMLENRPFGENEISKDPHGRPFFPDSDVDFNISHSSAIVAVSHVRGMGLRRKIRTGCDVERIRKRSGAAEIAKKYFSSMENKYLFSRGKFDETRFYEIWTLKECYLKLRGLGVFDMKQVPSFINEDPLTADELQFEFCAVTAQPLWFRLFELSDKERGRYILATVIEGESVQPEIRWFSPVSLNCKMRTEISPTFGSLGTVNQQHPEL